MMSPLKVEHEVDREARCCRKGGQAISQTKKMHLHAGNTQCVPALKKQCVKDNSSTRDLGDLEIYE